MKLHELSDNQGSRHARKRVGRGIGTGKGKTSGRGHKGQKSRAGATIKGFEGGQMPLYRRVPKRGFTNIFRKNYVAVNVGRLQQAIDAKKLDAKKTIDAEALVASGVVRRIRDGVRLLANGELNAKSPSKSLAPRRLPSKSLRRRAVRSLCWKHPQRLRSHRSW